MVRIICKGPENERKFFFDNDMGEPQEIDASCAAAFAVAWYQDNKLGVKEEGEATIWELLP